MKNNYHMKTPASNEEMAEFEKLLWKFDAATLSACMELTESERKEFFELTAEGVKYFEQASVDIVPLQRVVVGVQYVLNALKDWREKGPV